VTTPILLSGATGFIGRTVMGRLLTAGRSVIALARSRRGEAAGARVARATGRRPDRHLLDVVEADFLRPSCGLDEAALARLRETVETVIHCAGETAFFPRDPVSFRTGHLDGPLSLLQRLHGGRLRRWVHLSTAFVCGRRTGMVREDEADVGQEFHNPYERVKLEAEILLRQACGRLGIDVRVVRPSIVVGPAPMTSGGCPSHVLFGFIRMLADLSRLANGREIRLRIPVAPHGRLNLVPVEYVVEALVSVADHPEAAGKTLHLTASNPPTHEALLGLVCRRLGLRGPQLVGDGKAWLADASALERRMERMLVGYHEYLRQEVRFDDSNARGLLEQVGGSPPSLSAGAMDQLIALAMPCRTHVAERPHHAGGRMAWSVAR
jgi:nucleoside-diphosphate-sugar epimerase